MANSTTLNHLRKWLIAGKNQGAKFVIIAVSKNNKKASPLYAYNNLEFSLILYKKYYNILEIYDLSKNLEEQLAQPRSLNIGDTDGIRTITAMCF